MPKYIAKQSIGHFRPGEEIKGLESKQLQALLVSGAIEEYQEPKESKTDDSAARLAELEAEVAELKVNEEILIAQKDKAEAEVIELKVKVADLEKASVAEKKTTAKPVTEK